MSLRPPFDTEPAVQKTFTITRSEPMEEEKGLLAEAREWWRLASVKLAALVGILSSIITANPDLLITLAAVIPGATGPRLFFSLGVGALVFAVPTITRLWPQGDRAE